MKFFKDMLSEGSKISSIRFMMLLTGLIVLGTYVAQNVLSMIRNSGYIDFPVNSVAVLLIALGAKVMQHRAEAPKEEVPPAEEAPKADGEVPKA